MDRMLRIPELKLKRYIIRRPKMAQEETQATLPAGYAVITNATVKEVRQNQYDGFDLIAETISPLVGTPVEQRVPLYTTDFNTKKVSQDVIDNTQANLRRVLNDDTITFREVPDEKDPTDIVNWAAAHVGAPISALYVHEGKVRIAAPRAQSGNQTQRQSFWLKKYKPEMGEYDPDEQYMSFLEAQTDEDQKAITELDTKKLAQSTYKGRQSTTFFGEGTIQNILYTSAAPYKTVTKDLTAVEVIEYVAAILSQDAPEVLVPKASAEADKALAQKLVELKDNEKNGLYAIYSVLGGFTYLNNVSAERRDSVKQFLNTVAINVVSMYIRTKAGKVFQLSTGPMRRLDVSRTQTHGLHIEFLKNDFKSNDILLPLVDGGIIDEAEALKIAKENGYFNEADNVVEFKEMAEGMDFLRQLFNGKTVRYRSVVADDRGQTEPRLLGSNFIPAKAPADTDVTVEEPVAEAPSATAEDDDINPFGDASSSDDEPAKEEETVADESSAADDSAVGSNPFGV